MTFEEEFEAMKAADKLAEAKTPSASTAAALGDPISNETFMARAATLNKANTAAAPGDTGGVVPSISNEDFIARAATLNKANTAAAPGDDFQYTQEQMDVALSGSDAQAEENDYLDYEKLKTEALGTAPSSGEIDRAIEEAERKEKERAILDEGLMYHGDPAKAAPKLSFTDPIVADMHCAYLRGLSAQVQHVSHQLLHSFNPDITGYTLAFLVPPPFKYMPDAENKMKAFIDAVAILTPFAAIDFTPPQRQVQSGQVSGRTGGIPYATEVIPTEQASITYIDNQELNIFSFHYMWVEYIRELLEGTIEIPATSEYLDYNAPAYGALDYAGALFIARYYPDMKGLKYLGKCTGIYPQAIPSKELIGQRSTNELTTLPYTYFSGYYEEAMDKNHPIVAEFERHLTRFTPLCPDKGETVTMAAESGFLNTSIQNIGGNYGGGGTAVG